MHPSETMQEPQNVEAWRGALRSRLHAVRDTDGGWSGHLSSSALSTSVAAFAMECSDAEAHTANIRRARDWLLAHANDDGGFGDTPDAPSNLSTTVLAICALRLAPQGHDTLHHARVWLKQAINDAASGNHLAPDKLAAAIVAHYGKDRTFSTPILTMAALAGLLGHGSNAWRLVPALPFELAVLPACCFRLLRLPVVSYALPAMVAMGLAQAVNAPSRWLPWRRSRRLRSHALHVIRAMQPESGGYLEAAPLNGFVVMALHAAGCGEHPIAQESLRFLVSTQRVDGSWPIATDLSNWLTSLSVSALAAGGVWPEDWKHEKPRLRSLLLSRQTRNRHPFTRAAPGGWAWTPRSGGIPDSDDTAAALIALYRLEAEEPRKITCLAARNGIRWLTGVQNRDGGIPTFCRGWGRLPFDRSCADITAHALEAVSLWLPHLPPRDARLARRSRRRMRNYLLAEQHSDGSWLPLWFGNPWAPDHSNPVWGTAQVVTSLYRAACHTDDIALGNALKRGVTWLIHAQRDNGGWGGAPNINDSIEETAAAVVALLAAGSNRKKLAPAILRLQARIPDGVPDHPAPIGLYFASLWYSEPLYPLVYALTAAEVWTAKIKPDARGLRPDHSA